MDRFVRAVVAVGVAGLLAACGSSAKNSIDTTKVLTKAEYIEASDDICDTYGDRISGVVSSAPNDMSVDETKELYNKTLIPLFQAEHKELAALKPPPADAAELQGALRAMSTGIETIISRVEEASSHAALDAIDLKDIDKWKRAVGMYGMSICGPNTTTST